MNRLPAKDPDEVVVICFDFSAELGAESITGTPMVSCTVVNGTDATPGAVLYGAPEIAGQCIEQTVCAGVAGVDYKVRALITTDAGRALVLSGILPIREL